MRYRHIYEGRVYQIDGGYPKPVMVISNPSPPQARTLVNALHDIRMTVYLRGLLVIRTVYIWDGWKLTHDDVLTDLLPKVYAGSDDLCAFEIANYTMDGISPKIHSAKCTVLKYGPDPTISPFVRNIMTAIDALPR